MSATACVVVISPAQPLLRRVAEDRAAHREALDDGLCRATAAKPLASSSSGASRPSSTTPRHHGSFFAITAAMFSQALAEACGSSFHQSGLMPSA